MSARVFALGAGIFPGARIEPPQFGHGDVSFISDLNEISRSIESTIESKDLGFQLQIALQSGATAETRRNPFIIDTFPLRTRPRSCRCKVKSLRRTFNQSPRELNDAYSIHLARRSLAYPAQRDHFLARQPRVARFSLSMPRYLVMAPRNGEMTDAIRMSWGSGPIHGAQ